MSGEPFYRRGISPFYDRDGNLRPGQTIPAAPDPAAPVKHRAFCSCGWHGRAFRDGNAAWGSLDAHNEKCRDGRLGTVKEVES